MTTPTDLAIRRFFESTPRLAELCSQNGWPDNETLSVSVKRDAIPLSASVEFEEIVMEGAGCVAGRVRRWGEFGLSVAPDGTITDAVRVR